MFGEAATMPPESVAMIGRINAVEAVSAIGQLADTKVYRSDRIPES
ncbi:MAG: ABC transporter permease, partial [Alphaproteobacteria bacterium]